LRDEVLRSAEMVNAAAKTTPIVIRIIIV